MAAPLPRDPSLPGASTPAEGQRAPLPTPLTRFIGREDHIAVVAHRLSQPDLHLLTLTGPGGVGKTRLAIEVADRIAHVFDQVWFVPLAAVRDPALVVPTIMRALGSAEAGGISVLAGELRAILGDRSALLVLDNFEQVLDAGPEVVDILMACPSLKMLVTSRAPLRVSGEQVHAVTPLSLAGGPESIDQSEATLFFVDRATATVPSFRLTAGNREIVGEICRRLDGLPLAIELAVARLILFSPAELLARMDARLALLRDGATDQPDRLRSLHASIAWSYDLLNVDEQALFMRLAVFMGGWTLEAAEAVAAGSERDTSVQGGLTTLISRNLVWSEVQPDGTSRYGLLETIREFAEERLVAHGEDAAARDRHASWVLELARRTRTGNHQFEQILAIGPLEPEHSNIEAALHWLAATGQAERLADLVIALEHHWEWNEYGVQGLGWCMRALEARELSQSVRLEVLGGAAHLAEKLESPLAERLVEEYAAKAEECGTLRQRADAALLAGMHAEDSGDFPRAAALLLLACTQADQAGEAWISAQCSYHLGVVALGQGALDQAMATFDAAQAAATTIGDPLIPAWCLVYQALICCEQGNPERAAALLRNHPDMDQVGYRQHQPLLRAVASVVACRFGDYRRCARLLGSAIHDVPMRSPEKEITDRSATIARRALGDDEYRREWDAGHRMPPGEVRAEILQLLSEYASPTVAGSSATPHGLSMRELEVLRLIADGKTDRQIADTLSISPRTAEWHVRNVLGKLGAANRAEAAVLATRDYLV